MPRVRRRGNAVVFKTQTERRIWEILQDLHAQKRRKPKGPWTAPKSWAGLLAVKQFRIDCKKEDVPVEME
jgi:hypothetical protein